MTTILSQKDAVFKAVSAVRQPDGSFDRKAAIEQLFTMFRASEFAHSEPEKVREDKALRDYCGSILSNWLRKDPRLGGAEPSASKTGRKKAKPADDELVRLMKAKAKMMAEGVPTTEIDALITQRTQQINQAVADQAAEQAVEALNLADANAIVETSQAENSP